MPAKKRTSGPMRNNAQMEEALAKAQADAAIAQVEAKPCPSCGHCPHCGHTPQRARPWPYVYPRPYPYWQSPSWTITSTGTGGGNSYGQGFLGGGGSA